MRPVGRLPRLGAAALAAMVLTGCANEPMSKQGEKVQTLYNIVLAIALVIAVGVIGMILLSCVRYRKQPGDDTLPPQTHGNTTFEIIWTALPTLIVLLLFAMSFVTIRAIDKPAPASSNAAIIEVRGYQWSWTFDYGSNAAGVHVLVKTKDNNHPPEMVLPVGQKVHIEERSDNVIHSFFVPDFLFKRDVVPGKANGFDLTVTTPGVYKGQCAEMCGTEHAKMTFTVRAIGRAEFDKWFQGFKPPPIECKPGQPSANPVVHSVKGHTQFVEECIYVAAGQPFKLTFDNGGGLPHNVAIHEGEFSGKLIKETEIIQGGSTSVEVTGLDKGGNYNFFCKVHPLMQGRVVVQ